MSGDDNVLPLALWVLQTDAKGLRDCVTRDLGLSSQPVLFAQWTPVQVAGYWWDGVAPERQRILQNDFRTCQGCLEKMGETPVSPSAAAAAVVAAATKTTASASRAPTRPRPPLLQPPRAANLLDLAREIENERRAKREAATRLHRPPPPLQ
jgi:hypothetical protein